MIEACLIVWVCAIGALLKLSRKNAGSVGIPIAYLLSLGLQHVPGASLYAFGGQDYSMYDPFVVIEGFVVTTWGVGAFVAGTWAANLIVPRAVSGATAMIPSRADLSSSNRIAWLYFWGGLLVQTALAPLFISAGLVAVGSVFASFAIVGVCIGIASAQGHNNSVRTAQWIAMALSFPLITTIGSAFLGFGVHSLLVVFSFLACTTRLKWRHLPVVLTIVYVGLSVYVTYMRDRTELRELAWGEQAPLSSRIDHFIGAAKTFEWFDYRSEVHRNAIDVRMNQNWLVGQAKYQIDSGRIDYAAGETLWVALVAPIPRLLWPGKPSFGGSGSIVAEYTGEQFSDGTSVGVGSVMEFYINFSYLGVILGFGLLGVGCRYIDARANTALLANDLSGFTIWYLPGLAMVKSGGAFAEFIGALAASVIVAHFVAIVLFRLVLPRLRNVPV